MRTSLAHLGTGFSLTLGGREAFRLPPDQELPARLSAFWPPAICDGLSPFDFELHGYRVHGVAGSPATAQGRGNRILLFVNGRPVQDKLMMSAVRQAYKGMLLSREYPQIVLFLDMPREEVDVNVHPAKLEVRFVEESRVFSVIRGGVMQALSQPGMELAGGPLDGPGARPTGGVPPYAPTSGGGPERFTPSNEPTKRAHTPSSMGDGPKFSTYREFKSEYVPPKDLDLPMPPSAGLVRDSGAETAPMAAPILGATQEATLAGSGYTYLGQVADTYLVLRQGDSLVLVDQHAAHERILLAAMRDARTKGDSQPLGIPLELNLHPSEADVLQNLRDELRTMGFIIEMDGPNKALVRGIPPTLDTGKAREYLTDALVEKAKGLDDLWTMMACKTAIKANQALAVDEALALLETWLVTPEKDFCPHGRPVVLRWSSLDLEKQFKRK